jgi:AmiR/NasT family two-component response regulator
MTIPPKTIAIAEDDAGVRQFLQYILADLGYEFAGSAKNGAEAITLVKEIKPNVLIMDFHMPVMNGLEATQKIVLENTTAVIILTADPSPVVARQAMDFGACGYMPKPVEVSQIIPMIESAWHRFQTVRGLQAEMRALTENLETRKLLEKAKGILMEQQGYTEQEAHTTLQKMSQDQGIPIKEVCRSIVQVKMVLGAKSKNPTKNFTRNKS